MPLPRLSYICWLINFKSSQKFRKVTFQRVTVLESLFSKVAKSYFTSATSNERILQQVTSYFLQRATSTTSNEQILRRVTRDFLQRTTSALSSKRISQRVTSNILQRTISATSNKRILQRVTSDFLQRVTSTASKEWFFATSNFCNK